MGKRVTRRYCVSGGFCDYVAHLGSPGDGTVATVALRTPGGIATTQELAAFRQMVASINVIGLAKARN